MRPKKHTSAVDAEKDSKKAKHQHALTVAEILSDDLTLISLQHWASPSATSFNAELVDGIYRKELETHQPHRIMLLELSRYLENYLIPNFDDDSSSFSHLMSIVTLINEKFRERIPAWECFRQLDRKDGVKKGTGEGIFNAFFRRVLHSIKKEKLNMQERITYIRFLTNCFQSLEEEMVRKQALRLVSFPLLLGLTPGRLEEELKDRPRNVRDRIDAIQLKDKQTGQKALAQERSFVPDLVDQFLDFVGELGRAKKVPGQCRFPALSIRYVERFLELMLDLLSQLPTRRYFRLFLEDRKLVIRCRLSPLSRSRKHGTLFNQQLDRLRFYERFEVDDQEGTPISAAEVASMHSARIQTLQRISYRFFMPDLKPLAMANIASVEGRANLARFLACLSDDRLRDLGVRLNLFPDRDRSEAAAKLERLYGSREFMMEVIAAHFERRSSQIDSINLLSLYPTEINLWDENTVPSGDYFDGEQVLSLPKLNLQFLTFQDYLLRNFDLYRLESMFAIRGDVEDAVHRMRPSYNPAARDTSFDGWARMALSLKSGGFRVTSVGRPLLGEVTPSRVEAELAFNLSSVRPKIKEEWDSLRRHDVLFLVTVAMPTSEPDATSKRFPVRMGIAALRGCEIVDIADEEGNVISDGDLETGRRPSSAGNRRTLKVLLDASQYYRDTIESQTGVGYHDGAASNHDNQWKWSKGDTESKVKSKPNGKADQQADELSRQVPAVYKSFNLVIRRKSKQNNFKAILDTIRQLMNSHAVVPAWLHDTFLGYGDPQDSQPNHAEPLAIDFGDTFLSVDHLKACFPGKTIELLSDPRGDSYPVSPPFKITFPASKNDDDDDEEEEDIERILRVEPYTKIACGPYTLPSEIKSNRVPFTPTQIEAIRSGINHGLTMTVGPPGTGKTDVAVQIISILYHSFPQQRTLVVTHSNEALNQLFEKIAALDIDERHLLRLGHGQKLLETDKDFSKLGRVDYMLELRLRNLGEVERLAHSLGVQSDVAYTCENAAHFFALHVLPRWEQFLGKASAPAAAGFVAESFPFAEFFSNAPQAIFHGQSFERDMDAARSCFLYLRRLFEELDDCRAFELVRTSHDRANYLLTKQARIVAMTCTHAALKRADLAKLGFKFDNLLMEEAAQVLEIETFIPILLQDTDSAQASSRLKRCILIGDHHQLPPLVRNVAFQKFSNLDQSLFARFVRLGVPHVQLDKQGRSRPEIAELYNWRYDHLGNLTSSNAEYQLANPGFAYNFQLVNVDDYEGRGETEPSPHFIQNLGEAEFVVLTFMFMRLIGYPASSISIITTYNGQKALIRDVVEQRCASNPIFGRPRKITTVDRYQGQQNDFVLLSLVRTLTVGHLRDVRRLVVAMSRARLGLYVFCRKSLFENCYELTPTFSKLLQRPDKLTLVPNESFNADDRRHTGGPPPSEYAIQDLAHMSAIVYQNPSVSSPFKFVDS